MPACTPVPAPPGGRHLKRRLDEALHVVAGDAAVGAAALDPAPGRRRARARSGGSRAKRARVRWSSRRVALVETPVAARRWSAARLQTPPVRCGCGLLSTLPGRAVPKRLAAGAAADAAALLLTVAMTLPFETRSPTLTLTSLTTPPARGGNFHRGLVDSRVTSGVSFAIVSPAVISTSITGMSVKSPMSGTTRSIALAAHRS